MSTGGTGGDSGRLFNYGGSGGEQAPNKAGSGGGLMNLLKEALKPGDSRFRPTPATADEVTGAGDPTHDGRHGGIVETMQPGKQDYDVREEPQNQQPRRRHSSGGSVGGIGQGIADTVKKALGRDYHQEGESHHDATGATSAAGAFGHPRTRATTTENYSYYGQGAGYPSTGGSQGTFGRGSELGDRAVPRVSAFDSQGSVGHQFTVNYPALLSAPNNPLFPSSSP